MPSHAFGPRRPRSLAAQSALDAGLPVHIGSSLQRTIFSGAEHLSLEALTSELAEMLGSLRVRSFRLRAELEEVTVALQHNVECGFSVWAHRASQDLAGLLGHIANRRLADVELSIRGMNAALRISELLVQEASRTEGAEALAQCFEDKVRG